MAQIRPAESTNMEAAQILASDEYIRFRLQPRPGDPDYLCLIDLLNAVREMAFLDAPRVLDYGCGGLTYRLFFNGWVYHQADLAGGANLDHACPHDYWRWTAYGLRQAVENAGFGVLAANKITTGSRAALYLLEQKLDLRILDPGLYGRVLTYFVRLVCRLGSERRHQMADGSLKDYTVVGAQGVGETPDHALYIGVAILAQKPRN